MYGVCVTLANHLSPISCGQRPEGERLQETGGSGQGGGALLEEPVKARTINQHYHDEKNTSSHVATYSCKKQKHQHQKRKQRKQPARRRTCPWRQAICASRGRVRLARGRRQSSSGRGVTTDHSTMLRASALSPARRRGQRRGEGGGRGGREGRKRRTKGERRERRREWVQKNKRKEEEEEGEGAERQNERRTSDGDRRGSE